MKAQSTFRKVLKTPTGLFGFCVIFFFFLLALPGYLVTPDATPQANNMHPEISLLKPGTSVNILKFRKDKIEEVGFFSKWIYGEPLQFEEVVVRDWKVEGDTLFYSELVNKVHALERRVSINSLGLEEGESVEEDIYEKRTYWLGTDGKFGRDVMSRLIIGARISLSVGFVAVFISLTIGIFLGMVSGYFGGKLDAVIMWLINVMWSLPTLLLIIAISFILGKGFWIIFIAVGLSMWVDIARIIRGQVMSVKEREFISAAKVLGLPNRSIMFKHILPNIKGPIIVIAASNFASAILLEAGLSFLGLGVSPPNPSWGTMANENYGNIVGEFAYLAMVPGIAIMLLVMAFNLLGNALRDVLDVKM